MSQTGVLIMSISNFLTVREYLKIPRQKDKKQINKIIAIVM